jgi:zinc and cadmium transporter
MITALLLSLPILITGAIAFRVKMGQTAIRLILAFSAGYLFALSIVHMLPEIFEGENIRTAALFIVLGFCLQLVIDTFSAGIEHGHVHLHSNACHTHLPYGIIIGLYLHSFLEGLPVFDLHAAHADRVNYQLILGLAIHNLPITIAFVALLREHEHSGMKRWILLLLFAMMSPIGYGASYFLQTVGLNNYEVYGKLAYALVIGIFLHISTAILFESSVNHKYNVRKVVVMSLGIVLAYLIS